MPAIKTIKQHRRVIGTIKGKPLTLEVELRDTEKGTELSICGTWTDGAGQCRDALQMIDTPAHGITREDIERIGAIWDAWHLNGMRAGCQHQRASWPLTEPIEFRTYSIDWDVRRDLERMADHDAAALSRDTGHATRAPFRKYSHAAQLLHLLRDAKIEPFAYNSVTDTRQLARLRQHFDLIAPHALKTHSADADQYWQGLQDGRMMLKKAPKPPIFEKIETLPRCQVRHTEHPDGLLCKPCPECGYGYGTAWRFEPLPADVLADLDRIIFSTPDAGDPYDNAAAAFLTKYGITFHADHVQQKTATWAAKVENSANFRGMPSRAKHWIVTLDAGSHQLKFDFWNSENDTAQRLPLRAYSVLAAISSDSAYTDADDIDANRRLAVWARKIRQFCKRIAPGCLADLQDIS